MATVRVMLVEDSGETTYVNSERVLAESLLGVLDAAGRAVASFCSSVTKETNEVERRLAQKSSLRVGDLVPVGGTMYRVEQNYSSGRILLVRP